MSRIYKIHNLGIKTDYFDTFTKIDKIFENYIEHDLSNDVAVYKEDAGILNLVKNTKIFTTFNYDFIIQVDNTSLIAWCNIDLFWEKILEPIFKIKNNMLYANFMRDILKTKIGIENTTPMLDNTSVRNGIEKYLKRKHLPNFAI